MEGHEAIAEADLGVEALATDDVGLDPLGVLTWAVHEQCKMLPYPRRAKVDLAQLGSVFR